MGEILEVQDTLGRGSSAIVESVKCQRILLARKTIFCNRQLTKDDAVNEVAHLTHLDHAHIVRVIGTYTLDKQLSILTYPVAEHNLEEFLYEFSRTPRGDVQVKMFHHIRLFPHCLSSALRHVHKSLVKHMDIKPQNILVRRSFSPLVVAQDLGYKAPELSYKVYLTDFGISRSYQRSEEVETSGPTSFTRKYAAPEVIGQEPRGFPADVFSLGCVFLEIYTFVCNYFDPSEGERSASSEHQGLLNDNATSLPYYYAKIGQLKEYVGPNQWPFPGTTQLIFGLVSPGDTVEIIEMMLSPDTQARPTSRQLVHHFREFFCCKSGAESLEAMNISDDSVQHTSKK